MKHRLTCDPTTSQLFLVGVPPCSTTDSVRRSQVVSRIQVCHFAWFSLCLGYFLYLMCSETLTVIEVICELLRVKLTFWRQ